jgi:DNA-binding PadR family transcriptional regulator
MYRKSGSRSTLEVLILSLLRQGLTTTYDLQAQAGLSLGATVPALRRLALAKLVARKELGRRIEFSITREGEKTLGSWTVPHQAPTDMDDLLRSAYLAWVTAAGKKEAARLLRQGIRARRRWAEELQDELAGVEQPLATKPDAGSYRWLRRVAVAERAAADVKALGLLAQAFEWKQTKRR